MLNAALTYLKQGLSVIPLRPKGKEPLIPWVEFQKRRATEEEITAWYTKTPNANIGLVTGAISGIVIVDLDGPEGLASAERLGLKSYAVSLTGNGKHLYYRYPMDRQIRGSVKQVAPGVDIRAEGNYVVAAPSIHESGRRYRFLTPFKSVGALPRFPEQLIGMTRNGITLEGQKVVTTKEESWIAKALQEMTDGNIDTTLHRICSRLRADSWSADDARVLLSPHAERVGATPGHLDDKIANVWTRYKANSVTAPENEEAESIGSLLQDESEPEWIVPGLIANNSIGFCVGLPESNKTWIMMDLAISVATGGDWLGLFPVKRSKVLFIDQERWRGEGKRRFKSLLHNKGLRPIDMDNLLFKSGATIKIDLENSYRAFERLLEKVQPKLVIIDSLAAFHTKEENSRSEIQSVMEKMKKLRDQFGCTFLFISHSNKFAFQSASEGKVPDIGLMAGSIALPAAAETVLMVQKSKHGGSTVYHVKSTLSQHQEPFSVVVQDTDKGIQVRGAR